MSEGEWVIHLVDGDLEMPGWHVLPTDLDAGSKQEWLEASAAELAGSPGWDTEVVTVELARDLLEQALDQRAESPAMAMLQVWPPLGGQTATCYIDILPSDAMPVWTQTDDAVIHATSAPHLGSGLQLITQRMVSLDGTEDVEMTGVHFIFDDGEITVMLSLDEAITPLIGLTLPGLVALIHNVSVVNTATGERFEGVAPSGAPVDEAWDVEAGR